MERGLALLEHSLRGAARPHEAERILALVGES